MMKRNHKIMPVMLSLMLVMGMMSNPLAVFASDTETDTITNDENEPTGAGTDIATPSAIINIPDEELPEAEIDVLGRDDEGDGIVKTDTYYGVQITLYDSGLVTFTGTKNRSNVSSSISSTELNDIEVYNENAKKIFVDYIPYSDHDNVSGDTFITIHGKHVEEITFGENFLNNSSKLTSLNGAFHGMQSLKAVDISGWDTSRVTNMSWMFNGCQALTSITMTGIDTNHVTNMEQMLSGCSSLGSVDFLGTLDVSNVRDMHHLCFNCDSITDVTIEGWQTNHLETATSMFANCDALRQVHLPDMDVSNVTNFGVMFGYNTKLVSIDCSGWNTGAGTDFFGMFSGCMSLSSLTFDFDMQNATSCKAMFNGCMSLTDLDVSSWNTPHLTDISAMFGFCRVLKKLDLSNWDAGNIEEKGALIDGTPNLHVFIPPQNLTEDWGSGQADNRFFPRAFYKVDLSTMKVIDDADKVYNYIPASETINQRLMLVDENHDWSAYVYDDQRDMDISECNVCGCIREKEHIHDYVKTGTVPANCIDKGKTVYVCNTCNHSYEDEIPALGHDAGDEALIDTKQPTCVLTGSYTYATHCNRCHIKLNGRTEPISALGHDPGEPVIENQTKTGYDKVIYCKRCNKELSREHIEITTPDPVKPTPDPADPTPDPVNPTPDPVKPTPDPVQPTPDPVDPTPEPVKPANPDPVQPAPEPKPDPKPVAPASEPIQPVPEQKSDPASEPLAVPDTEASETTPVIEPETTDPIPKDQPRPDPGIDPPKMDKPVNRPIDEPSDDPAEEEPAPDPETIVIPDPKPTPPDEHDDDATEKTKRNSILIAVSTVVIVVSGSMALLVILWWRRKISGHIEGLNVEGLHVTLVGKDHLETYTDRYGAFAFKNVKEDDMLLTVYDADTGVILRTEIYTKGKNIEDICSRTCV